MKPVTHLFVAFVPERVIKIRFNRDLALAEGRGAMIEKKRRKSSATRKPKATELSAATKTAMAGASDEMKAFLEAALKGK